MGYAMRNHVQMGQVRPTNSKPVPKRLKKLSIVKLLIDLALLALFLLMASYAHGQDAVTYREFDKNSTEINGHLEYDDKRIEKLEGDLSFIRGICYAVAALSAGSIGITFKELKK